MTEGSQKITFAEMREMGVRGLLIICADYPAATRSPSVPIMCRACGKRGADVRPDFN